MDPQQKENIERVSVRIGAAITRFCAGQETFHADELRRYVASECGALAPASADRILRDLRKRKVLNYEVTSRRNSTYKILPVVKEPAAPVQMKLGEYNWGKGKQ